MIGFRNAVRAAVIPLYKCVRRDKSLAVRGVAAGRAALSADDYAKCMTLAQWA
jgi:hypothetical protein